MSGNALTVQEAANAAQSIYEGKLGPVAAAQALEARPGLAEKFDFEPLKQPNASGFMTGRTGAFIKIKSGFGVIAKGKGNYSNQTLVVIRGTDLKPDWLTDANIGVQLSSTSKIVHAGFNRVFNDLQPFLNTYFSNNSVGTLHCVGHSLGGALASLTAEWAKAKNISDDINLYTFGSPRVGFPPFSKRLTENIGEKNIYRVHHNNDFVSLVPLWPFVHLPQPGSSCCIHNHGYGCFSAHKMANYQKSIKGKDWEMLRAGNMTVAPKADIKNMLSWDGAQAISMRTLSMIGSAVQYILKAAGVAVQLGLVVGVSVLDMMSYALEKAYRVSTKIAGWIKTLLEKILHLVGVTVQTTFNITVGFIRWVFSLLTAAVTRLVNLSLRGNEA